MNKIEQKLIELDKLSKSIPLKIPRYFIEFPAITYFTIIMLNFSASLVLRKLIIIY